MPTQGFFIGEIIIMTKHKFLTCKEQVMVFKNRGMIIEDEKDAERILNFINYYKLKECSLPFFKDGKYIQGITFNQVLNRFYENKNLRLYLLRLTEKIELSLKTKFSHLMGKKLGEYGYLDFFEWVDKVECNKKERIFREKDLRKRIERNLERSNNKLLDVYKKSDDEIINIPIWLVIDILTFGEVLNLYKILYKKYQNQIAKDHNLKREVYLSWLETINLIRNLSAHNSNITDMKFTTKPKILEEFKSKLYVVNGKVSDRIAIAILILEYLVYVINPKYTGGAIRKTLKKICHNRTDKEAQKLGFKDFETVESLKI